jgi:predicted nucleic acid-binding protein
MELIADTSFLVGLWRKQSWAVGFAQSNRQRVPGIPWVVLGEFWHGARKASDEAAAQKHLTAARSIYQDAGCKLFDESIQTVKF